MIVSMSGKNERIEVPFFYVAFLGQEQVDCWEETTRHWEQTAFSPDGLVQQERRRVCRAGHLSRSNHDHGEKNDVVELAAVPWTQVPWS